MSRFYKTSTPDYVEDFMYTPPWEMMGQVMAQNEQGIQQTLASTSVFEDLDIDYIEDPVVQQQVEAIKNKYAGEADEISKTLQAQIASNPQSWRNQLPKISNLGKELQKDFKSGQVNKIMSDKKRLATWIEENKDLQKTDPMLFNAGYQYFMNEWRSDPERKKDWEGQRLSTFDINSKEIIDAIKDTPIRKQSGIVVPGYIMNSEGRDKNAIIRDYMVTAFSDPEAQLYLQQAIQFGIPGFVDEEGEPIPIEVYKNLETGEVVSEEEYEKEKRIYNKASAEQKAMVGETETSEFKYGLVPNEKFAWTKNFANIAERYGGVISQDLKADATYNQAANRAATRSNIILREQLSRENEAIKAVAAAIEESQKESRERIKKRIELQDIIDTIDALDENGEEVTPNSRKEYERAKIELHRLESQSTKEIALVRHNLNYDKTIDDIRNPVNYSPDYLAKKNIDNNITTVVLQELGYIKGSHTILDENGVPQLVVDPLFKKGSVQSLEARDLMDHNNLVIATHLEFEQLFTGNKLATFDLDIDEKISDFLVENLDVPPEKLYTENTVNGKIRRTYTRYHNELTKDVNNITAKKKELYKKYSESETSLTLLPFSEKGSLDTQIFMRENFGSYSPVPIQNVGKVDDSPIPEGLSTKEVSEIKKERAEEEKRLRTLETDTSKYPSVRELATNGHFQSVALNSYVGEAPVVEYNKVKYILVPNQDISSNFVQNQMLYGDPETFADRTDYDKVYPGLVNNLQSVITSSLANLEKVPVTIDGNNSNKDGESLRYRSTAIPLAFGESLNIRHYENQDYGYPFQLRNSKGERLIEAKNMEDLNNRIKDYIEALTKEQVKKGNNVLGEVDGNFRGYN